MATCLLAGTVHALQKMKNKSARYSPLMADVDPCTAAAAAAAAAAVVLAAHLFRPQCVVPLSTAVELPG
jgi:hypothetical protein